MHQSPWKQVHLSMPVWRNASFKAVGALRGCPAPKLNFERLGMPYSQLTAPVQFLQAFYNKSWSSSLQKLAHLGLS